MGDILFDFLKKFGFVIIQQNGQRIIGPKGADDSPTYNEIFLSQLPKEFKEEDIIPYLSRFHDICKIRTMLNFSGDCRGFCYIDFKEKNSSITACAFFNQTYLYNKAIKCTTSDEDCRVLFVAFNWRIIRVVDMIWELLQDIHFITDGKTAVEKITVHDHNSHGLIHCFIKFNEHGKAASVRKHFRNKNKNVFYYAYFDWKKRCGQYRHLPQKILEIHLDPDDIYKVPKTVMINREKCLDYCDLQVVLV